MWDSEVIKSKTVIRIKNRILKNEGDIVELVTIETLLFSNGN